MKKLPLTIAAAALSAVCLFASACTGGGTYVANDATDLLQEDFGIAVKKGDTETLEAVNAVVDKWTEDGTMQKYFDYFTELGDETKSPAAPADLKLTWDLSSYTETLDMFTEAGFAPYEFVHASGYAVSDGSSEEGAYNLSGLDVAIACEVAESMQCKLVIHDVAFDNVITNLNATAGKALVAAGLTITEERAQEVAFSNIYSSSTLSIVCAEGAGYTSLKSLDGLKIGVQEGTSGDLIASAAMKADGYSYETGEGDDATTTTIKLTSPDTEVVQYKAYAAALAALKAGKIDVIFMDKVPALLLLTNV